MEAIFSDWICASKEKVMPFLRRLCNAAAACSPCWIVAVYCPCVPWDRFLFSVSFVNGLFLCGSSHVMSCRRLRRHSH
jgi:hypothetical protein